MKQNLNNLEVKKWNRNRVFRYINSQDITSMPEIAAELELSVPTVLAIVNELENMQVIREAGYRDSTGGRKAKAFAAIKDVKYAIGVDITKNHVSIVYTDLSEKVLKHKRIRRTFQHTQTYLLEIVKITDDFIQQNSIPRERIVGMGISLPAIIDEEKSVITNSRALDIYSVPCEEWMECMPLPCDLVNDANAAAFTEINIGETHGNMVYLSLSNTVGGAVVLGNDADRGYHWEPIYKGNNWRSSEFGHMVIHPGGKLCYCGKSGCADTYCSALRLAEQADGKLELFFEKLQAGDNKFQEIWMEYLNNLIIVIDNLRMCYDCDVVIGGYVGSYIEPYLNEIRKAAAERNIFGVDTYIKACRYQVEASALGAAMFQIDKYIEKI
ncbi:MAG: ROK family transcriptional regulator [Lachnospiraceae bacterium]